MLQAAFARYANSADACETNFAHARSAPGAVQIGETPMCDYSLTDVRSRPAQVGDKLITRDFGTGTRGFGAARDPSVAICVLPGTELSLRRRREMFVVRPVSWREKAVNYRTAIRFRQIQQRQGRRPSRCARISRRPGRIADSVDRVRAAAGPRRPARLHQCLRFSRHRAAAQMANRRDHRRADDQRHRRRNRRHRRKKP